MQLRHNADVGDNFGFRRMRVRQRFSQKGDWDEFIICCMNINTYDVLLLRLAKDTLVLHRSIKLLPDTCVLMECSDGMHLEAPLWPFTLPSGGVACVSRDRLQTATGGHFELARQWGDVCTAAWITEGGSSILIELRDDFMEGTQMAIKYQVLDAVTGVILHALDCSALDRTTFIVMDDYVFQQTALDHTCLEISSLETGKSVTPKVPWKEWSVVVSGGSRLLIVEDSTTKQLWVAECKFGDDRLPVAHIIEE